MNQRKKILCDIYMTTACGVLKLFVYHNYMISYSVLYQVVEIIKFHNMTHFTQILRFKTTEKRYPCSWVMKCIQMLRYLVKIDSLDVKGRYKLTKGKYIPIYHVSGSGDIEISKLVTLAFTKFLLCLYW